MSFARGSNRKIKEVRPGGEVTTYTYDAANNLVSTATASGNKHMYTYDALNRRVTEERYLGRSGVTSANVTRRITYFYDKVGNLTMYSDTESNGGASSLVTSGTYILDELNRLVSQTINYGTFNKTHTFAHTLAGRTLSRTDPGTVIPAHTIAYDAAGRVQKVTLPTGIGEIAIGSYTWDQMNDATFPNGIKQTWQYDKLQRIIRINVNRTDAVNITPQASIMDFAYELDEVNNIMRINKQGNAVSYGYDNLYRLTSVTPSLALTTDMQGQPNQPGRGITVENYTYDLVHNRVTDQNGQRYIYNANHQLAQITKGTSTAPIAIQTIDHNTDGHASKITSTANASAINNPSTASVRELIYDAVERLSEVRDDGQTTAIYMYDPHGRRIKKTALGVTTYYGYSSEGLVAEYDAVGNQTRAYAYWPGQSWQTSPLYQRDTATANSATSASAYHFVHSDHLGASQLMTTVSAQGTSTVSWRVDYEAFGKAYAASGNVVQNNLRFPGQYLDQETDLYYNYFRDYDPSTGRYIESDPIGLEGGMNRYVYTQQHPTVWTDPTGEIIFIPIIINGLVSAAIEGVTTGLTKGWDCVNVQDMLLAGAAGAAFSGAAAGAVKIFMKDGGYKILGATLLKKGTPKPDGYVNHQIFKFGTNRSNFRIEWASTVGNKGPTEKLINATQIPHFHIPGRHAHYPLPPLSGGPIGYVMAKQMEPCECK